MRVLHIITGSDNGGGGEHVLNICKYSKDSCNTLGCIGTGELYNKGKKENVNTILFPNKIINKKIIEYINNEKIEVVNFHGPKAFLVHRFLKNKIKVPCVASVHSDYRYDFLNNKIKHIFFTPLSKWGLKSFKNYMCVSEYINELLNKEGFKGEKCIVNNGICMDKICISKSRNEVREEYNIPKDSFVFVIVARLHPVKNHKGLINAFYKLSKEFKGIKLLIIGEGNMKEVLKKQVEDLNLTKNVIFTGFVKNPINFINASDISVLTSFNEGGSPPIAILESGIVKKTILSTKVGDIDKNFTSKMVFIIKKNNEEEIYKSMKKVVINRDNLKSMGEGLYNEIVKNYTMDKFCTIYYDFYKKLIKKTLRKKNKKNN